MQKLVRLQLRRQLRAALSSSFGIAMGIASLVFFVSLGLGVGRVVREKIFPVDSNMVEVIPSPLAIGLLGGGTLRQDTVNRLAALSGVERVYRKMNVRLPAVSTYDGDFFGQRLRLGVEVVATGVDPAFVRADVHIGDFSDGGSQKPIPVVLASRLLEIYNKTFAPARSLPQLSASMLEGFRFPVDWNRSFVAAVAPGAVLSTQAQVVGVSNRGLLAGLTIPLDVAIRLNQGAHVDTQTFSAVALEATSPAAVPAIVAAVKEMGLQVDDQERRMGENAGAAIVIVTAALTLLSGLVCLLAAFNIAHALSAAVRAREKELGVMRAVGARQGDIFALVMVEALVLGFAGGIGGAGVARLAAWATDTLAGRVLPPFPFKPDTFFVMPWWLPAFGIALGMLAATLGAWGPARWAAKVDPARVLAG